MRAPPASLVKRPRARRPRPRGTRGAEGNGGEESICGWCKDRWEISWQITPRALIDALAVGGYEAKRAFGAMMAMRKIDVAVIEAARRA
ncbi:MAG: VOC family protein [Acidibrevibacterium sp.]|uniref:VOC family protein n=1 Tax=Acidibrevibacterium sp. TaxID=2606776 RepID=UPI003D027416